MNPELSALTALAGVQQAVISNDAGHLLDSAGVGEPPDAAILVLAHATLAAAAELGRRSGSGACLEIVQQHADGVIYLHSLPQARLLLARCQTTAAIPAIRLACQRFAQAPATPARPVSTLPLDLAAALHAEPAW